MKFSCSKEKLDQQLQYVTKIITSRQNLPILSNILLETDKNILRISSTDLEITITTHLEAKILQEGVFTVPARIFQDFVHQNPDSELEFELESFDLVCRSKKIQAKISGMDSEDYPSLPKLENGKRFILPLKDTIEALKQVSIACAVDQTRIILTGILAVFLEDSLILAATDSFRLVEKKLKIIPTKDELNILIPNPTIQELIRVGTFFTNQEDIEVEVGEKQVIFRIKEVEIYSNLLTGTFPKYQTIIPQKFISIAEVTTSELVQALRISNIFSSTGNSNALFEINKEGVFTIANYNNQKGSLKNTIYAFLNTDFQPLKIAFNTKYLLDACNSAKAEHLSLYFSGETSALMLKTDDLNHLQLVMPIRLDS
jgi:DNA polymerase-3 subunit beta